MRLQSLLVVALALVFGGSAAVGVRSFVNNRGAATKGDTVSVVVAVIDISRGGMITSDLIKMREYPKTMVPAGALTKSEEAIGRAVAIPLVKDETVLDAKLSPKGAGRGLAALVPTGMRAVTIQTPNVASGVAGFVMPGNKVDVLLTVSDSGGNNSDTGGGSTTTLLQRVEILAVDQRIDAPADNKVDVKELRSVTLLVTPHQANLLDLGQNKGTLHLSLRNLQDDQDSNIQPATLADLRFRHEKPWDEKAKGFLSVLGEVLARRAATAPVPTPTPPPAPVVAAPAPVVAAPAPVVAAPAPVVAAPAPVVAAPAPAPAPVVAIPPPAPPRPRFLTIYRGPSNPTYQQLDQNSNGEPRAQDATNPDQTGARQVPTPATRATPASDTRLGAKP